MNYATLNFYSPALNRHVDYNVILPIDAAGPGPFPVVYQLHGLTDDHHGWTRNSRLARHARRWPLIIVMPNGGTSFYMNQASERFEDFLTQDLPASVLRTFPAQAGPAAIGGLSMGGYGALRLALRYPDQYISVWAHSSALLTAEEAVTRYGWMPERAERLDIYNVAAESVGRIKRGEVPPPRITFDCGTEDFLLEHNRRFMRYLNDEGIPHMYNERPGNHDWEFWDERVPLALAQHAAVFGRSPVE